MKKASISIEKLIIKTYREPDREELPIFCENRMHQLTSGRTYPNKVVTAGALKESISPITSFPLYRSRS